MNNFNSKLTKFFAPFFLLVGLILMCPNVAASTFEELTIAEKDINSQSEASYREIYTWYRRGNELYRQEKYLESISAYEKAIQLDSTFDLALNGKGWALRALSDYPRALNAFEQAISINPDSYEHWQGKGNTLYYLGRFKESLKAYNVSLEINPDSHASWGGKSWALGRLKQYKTALKAVEKAIEINDQLGNYWLAKGWILYESESYFEARNALQKSLVIEPKNKFAQHYLKLVERQLGKRKIT